MRILATFAFSFAAAVFGAVYGELDPLLLPLGGALALAAVLTGLLVREKGHARTRAVLILSGLSVGLLWTALYMSVFFQPARDLDGRTVRLSAVVADWPQAGEYGGYTVVVQAETEGWAKVSAILYTDEQGADLRPGDRIGTVAHCTLGDRTFSGEKITYYTAKGIFLRARAYGRLEILRGEKTVPQYWAAYGSKALKEGIDTAFPEEASGFVRALVTGNRDNLTDQFTTSLQRTGLSHTVAVSGMHLAFLSSLLTYLLGQGRRSTAFFTILWVILFCGIAGNTPSVLRAAVMVLMLQFAPLLNRERDGPTALSLALLVLLWVNPFSAAHIGLQLSFTSVAGILLVSDRVQDWLMKVFRLDGWKKPKSRVVRYLRAGPYFVVSTLSATLGASVLTMSLVALHFNMISLISPLSNLMTLWAIGTLFLGGLGVGALALVLPGAAAVLAIPFTGLVRYLQWVIDLLSRPALAALPLESVYYRAWLVLVYALILVSVRMKGKRPVWMPLAAGGVGLALAMVLTRQSFYLGDMGVTVLDTGQGQSVLLRSGHYLTLVDCGGDSMDNPGDIAANYLQAVGRSGLDLLVVSHYHADHANGIPQLLRRIDVGEIVLPDVEEDSPLRAEIIAAAVERGVPVRFVQETAWFRPSRADMIAVFPPMLAGKNVNELGLTVLASHKALDVLITGDMEEEGERRLTETVPLPDVEVLVAGHHGSNTSNTPELLEAVRPELALISVGRNNKYGHPDWDTLVRLNNIGAEIYRTDLYGTVEVKLNE